MAITLRTRGTFKGDDARFTVRATLSGVQELDRRQDYALVLKELPTRIDARDIAGYSAIIVGEGSERERPFDFGVPVFDVRSIEHISEGHILSIEPRSGTVLTVFRPESRHNVIFTTERCNSNCLMCSQPPKDIDDSWRFSEHLRVLSLIETPPEFLCITGGEPTLLGDSLVRLLEEIRDRLPGTSVQMLTNGRSYANPALVSKIASVKHPTLISAIPLYADIAGIHDHIVQAFGAFDQTVEGLYNAAEAGLAVEIRIVLHKQSIRRLLPLVEYIYRNFPFASHVALMGMEHMGYVKKNWESLWIDPADYTSMLFDAVQFLWRRQMNVSIYNLQLCLLPPELWQFARRSISDYKNEYVAECDGCSQRDHCCGLFTSQVGRYSAHLRAIRDPSSAG